jgi:hypothetical protein
MRGWYGKRYLWLILNNRIFVGAEKSISWDSLPDMNWNADHCLEYLVI